MVCWISQWGKPPFEKVEGGFTNCDAHKTGADLLNDDIPF